MQFVKYFETYRHSDPLGLKGYVGGLALLTWAISIFTLCVPARSPVYRMFTYHRYSVASAIVWYLFAVHFGEFLGGEAGSTANWLGGSSTVVVGVLIAVHPHAYFRNKRAAAGLYVQAYFCERLFLLSKKWYIVAPMGLIFVTAFASNVTAVGDRNCSLQQLSNWSCRHLITSPKESSVLISLSNGVSDGRRLYLSFLNFLFFASQYTASINYG
jgi:hypothetical protein